MNLKDAIDEQINIAVKNQAKATTAIDAENWNGYIKGLKWAALQVEIYEEETKRRFKRVENGFVEASYMYTRCGVKLTWGEIVYKELPENSILVDA